MRYNLSMFEKMIFVVTVNNDVVGIQATVSLEKCGRTVFEIVSSTDDFGIIKKWDQPSCLIVTVISLSIWTADTFILVSRLNVVFGAFLHGALN